MKKCISIAILLFFIMCITACGNTKTFEPNYEKAVGMIFIYGEHSSENEIVSAKQDGHSFRFENIDAASAFYFDISADEAIAGEQNMYSLQLASDETNGAAGAIGTIAYQDNSDENNIITAYYLYYDGNSLYYNSKNPVFTEAVKDGLKIQGEDYACEVTFMLREPNYSFSVTYCGEGKTIIQELTFTPQEVEDYQLFEVPDNTKKIKITTYRADGTCINTDEIKSDQSSVTIPFDDGGKILASKVLRIKWPE